MRSQHHMGLTLDMEELQVLARYNQSSQPLLLLKSLAGCGKSVVGQVVLQAFLSREEALREQGFALGAARQ